MHVAYLINLTPPKPRSDEQVNLFSLFLQRINWAKNLVTGDGKQAEDKKNKQNEIKD